MRQARSKVGHRPGVVHSSAAWLIGVVVSASVLVLCGCGQSEQRVFGGKQTPAASEISKDRLHRSLDLFEEFAAAKNAQAANGACPKLS